MGWDKMAHLAGWLNEWILIHQSITRSCSSLYKHIHLNILMKSQPLWYIQIKSKWIHQHILALHSSSCFPLCLRQLMTQSSANQRSWRRHGKYEPELHLNANTWSWGSPILRIVSDVEKQEFMAVICSNNISLLGFVEGNILRIDLIKALH